jgi:hypothetical protein
MHTAENTPNKGLTGVVFTITINYLWCMVQVKLQVETLREEKRHTKQY